MLNNDWPKDNLDKKTPETENKIELKKNPEYPRVLKGLHPMDGTEEKTISFAREGGGDHLYSMKDEKKGDGDSLYGKISEEKGDEFYLIDGNNLQDAGDFVVGFFNEANKEIKVGNEQYPVAVYLKRNDRISPETVEDTKDSDVLKEESYKLCFYDKNANEFITQTIDKHFVSQVGMGNLVDVKISENNIIICYPETGVYDDGYKVGVKEGAKILKLSDVISAGKIDKAEEYKNKGETEKSEKIAISAIETIKDLCGKNIEVSDLKFAYEISKQFDLKDKKEVAKELFDLMIKKGYGFSSRGEFDQYNIDLLKEIGESAGIANKEGMINEIIIKTFKHKIRHEVWSVGEFLNGEKIDKESVKECVLEYWEEQNFPSWYMDYMLKYGVDAKTIFDFAEKNNKIMSDKLGELVSSVHPKIIGSYSRDNNERWWRQRDIMKKLVKEWGLPFEKFEENDKISEDVKEIIKRSIYGEDSF